VSAWHWPQWTEAGLLAFGTIIAVCRHGEPREKYDAGDRAVGVALVVWVLWCGGFWG
jgi:hypothetical protein